MSKQTSKLSGSLKRLGDTDISDLDFMALLHKDIEDLEITHSLRKLGNIKVTDWDFRSVLPAVNRLARQEVDLVDMFKRAAHYKVMEWDFRDALPRADAVAAGASIELQEAHLNPAEMQEIIVRLKDFLQYVAVNLIGSPEHAQIKVHVIGPNVLRFKVLLVKKDVAMLVGREGHTASAIRGMLKACAGIHGVHALLQIHSHEQEMAAKWAEEESGTD